MSIESQVSEAITEIEQTLTEGLSLEPIIERLLMTDPQVVMELLLQHRIEHPVFAQMMLLISKDLEAFAEPEQLYMALAIQMRFNPEALLDVLFERHGTALWLPRVCQQVEGARVGYYHLMYKHQSHARDLPIWCVRYALNGARDGLVAFAEDTGNPIPAAVLYGFNDERAAFQAAVGSFRRNPKSPVLEFLFARVGPNIDAFVARIVEELSSDGRPLPPMLEWWRNQ